MITVTYILNPEDFYRTLYHFMYLNNHLMKNWTDNRKKVSQSDNFLFYIRNISESVSEPLRVIPNESEKRFVFHKIKNGQKSIRTSHIQYG